MSTISKRKQSSNTLEELKGELKKWETKPEKYENIPIFTTKDVIEAVKSGKIFIMSGKAWGKLRYFVLATLVVIIIIITNIMYNLAYAIIFNIALISVAVVGYIRWILDITNNKKGFIVLGPWGIYYKISNNEPLSREWKFIDQIGLSVNPEDLEKIEERNKILLKSNDGWEVTFKWEHYKHPQILNFNLLMQVFKMYWSQYSSKYK